tara:strand:+ start:10 stop:1434 length:1425 start_codon:yes stop_codon:yes gene_type:complete
MAPKSSIEQNDGVQMMEEGGKPKNRMEALLAYLRSLGADEEEEIKEATGGKSLAEIINFGGDYRPVKKADGGVVKMFTGGIGGISSDPSDFIGYNTMGDAIKGYGDDLQASKELLADGSISKEDFLKLRNEIIGPNYLLATAPLRDGLSNKTLDALMPPSMSDDDQSDDEQLEVGSGESLTYGGRKIRNKNEVTDQGDATSSGRNEPKRADQDRSSFIVDVFNEFTNPKSRKDRIAEQEIKDQFGLETEDIPISDIPNFDGATIDQASQDIPDELRMPEFNNTPKDPNTDPDPDPDSSSSLNSVESEILNMLKENEEEREQDKYLALAKMGLALMSSSQPTFGGALGEAGMAGLDDLQASRKSYRDDKITLLDARRKLEQARATAASKDKSGLTGSNIVSLLNNARTRKSNTLAKIAEEMPTGIEAATPMTPEKLAAIEGLRRDVARLDVEISTYEAMLGGIGSLGVDLNATAN